MTSRSTDPTATRPDSFESERGSLLVLALIVIFLMTVLATDVFDVSMVEYESSVNIGKISRLEYALNAGLEIAKSNLIQDGTDTDIDSLGDVWATPIKETFGGESAESVKEIASEKGSEKIEVTIEIEDEESKWPLPIALLGNDAQMKKRREFLTAVIDSFREDCGNKDIDSGTAARYAEMIIAFMTRKEHEQGVVPRPNTKSEMHILNVADLALIEGMDDDILYDSTDDKGNLIPGLLRFITISSYDLKVNINTAPLPVLRGLFRPEDRGRADDIYHHRTAQSEEKDREKKSKAGQLEDKSKTQDKDKDKQDEDRAGGAIFEKVTDVQKVEGFSPRIYTEASGMMSVASKTFSVWITAELGPISRQRHWILRREGARVIVILSEAIDPDYRPRFRKPRPDEEEAEVRGPR